MTKLIQLQYIINGSNAGGLYLNPEHIVSIRSYDMRCFILTISGVEYEVINEMQEVFEKIWESNKFNNL